MRILSLDPGGTTGYVVVSASHVSGKIEWLEFSELTGEHHLPLRQLMRKHYQAASYSLILICERYDHRNAVAKLIANEYIGVVKEFEQEFDVPALYPGADEGKRFGTNDKLVALGILQKPLHAKRHINDAARHAVTYLCTKAHPNIKTVVLRQLRSLT